MAFAATLWHAQSHFVVLPSNCPNPATNDGFGQSHRRLVSGSRNRRRPAAAGMLGRIIRHVGGRYGHVKSSKAGIGMIAVEDVLVDRKWPDAWPYSPLDFSRQDESTDGLFYAQPRLVTHIHDAAIAALTKYYAKQIKPGSDVLDLCSSWVSHYPETLPLGKVVGLGMNKVELQQNTRLTSFDLVDLNTTPSLPYPDRAFDVVTNVVSVDYLTKPLEVFKEMARVLKPGGKAIMSFSNRCFPTKVTAIWFRTNDIGHVFIVGSFFHYAGGFEAPAAIDISPSRDSIPMYIVQAIRK